MITDTLDTQNTCNLSSEENKKKDFKHFFKDQESPRLRNTITVFSVLRLHFKNRIEITDHIE